jgi:Phage GNAT-like domain
VPSPGVLFPAVTESPSREFIAAQLQAAGCKKLTVPAAGRFAVCAAAVPLLGAANITAYDTGLIPTLLGYLADPRRDLADLVLAMPSRPGLAVFLDGGHDEYDQAAGVMLAVRYLAMPRDTAYMAEQAKAVRAAAAGLRTWLAGQLRTQAALLAGLRYDIKAIGEAAVDSGPDGAVFLDLRGLNTHARKHLTAAEQMFWDSPPDPFNLKADGPRLLEALAGQEQLAIACVTGDKLIPEDWVRLAAVQSAGKTDYVIASRDPGGRLVKIRRRPGEATEWPLYAEQEITAESELGIVCVDKDTALHYRDLIIHRLAGTTVSERYYLFTVDGRVVSVFGLHFRDQVTGKTPYCSMTFGISLTSQRYARLGKLLMLCLTSTDMLAFLLHTVPNMLQRNPPAGLATSSPAQHEEGKGSGRGVMRLVRRDPMPGGGFALRYETEWRPESWPQVMARWHREQAWITRPGWDGPRLPQPQPEVKKRKRGRGAARREDSDEQAETAAGAVGRAAEHAADDPGAG